MRGALIKMSRKWIAILVHKVSGNSHASTFLWVGTFCCLDFIGRRWECAARGDAKCKCRITVEMAVTQWKRSNLNYIRTLTVLYLEISLIRMVIRLARGCTVRKILVRRQGCIRRRDINGLAFCDAKNKWGDAKSKTHLVELHKTLEKSGGYYQCILLHLRWRWAVSRCH
jgi:hypothetical protein